MKSIDTNTHPGFLVGELKADPSGNPSASDRKQERGKSDARRMKRNHGRK